MDSRDRFDLLGSLQPKKLKGITAYNKGHPGGIVTSL